MRISRADGDPARALLAALQLGDPGLPIGRFVHSHGLESWLADRPDAGAGEIRELVATFLREGVAPLDGAAVALAHRARSLEELVSVDRAVSARKTFAPARASSQSCGRQLAALAVRLTDDDLVAQLVAAVRDGRVDGNLAVVTGALSRALGVGEREAVVIELWGAMTSLTSGAVRLGRLTPISAQVLIRQLAPDLLAATGEALNTAPSEMRSSAVELDLASLVHPRREARMFST